VGRRVGALAARLLFWDLQSAGFGPGCAGRGAEHPGFRGWASPRQGGSTPGAVRAPGSPWLGASAHPSGTVELIPSSTTPRHHAELPAQDPAQPRPPSLHGARSIPPLQGWERSG